MYNDKRFSFIFHTFHIAIQQYIAANLVAIYRIPQRLQHLASIPYASHFKLSFFHRFTSVFFNTQDNSSTNSIGK